MGSITYFTFEDFYFDLKLRFLDCKVSNEGKRSCSTVTITSSINKFKSNEENVLGRESDVSHFA